MDWKLQFVRALFPYTNNRINIAQAAKIKGANFPTKLYKYRQFNERHIAALKSGELWLCAPEKFNDPYDTWALFDTSRLFQEDIGIDEIENRIRNGNSNNITAHRPYDQCDWMEGKKLRDKWLSQLAARHPDVEIEHLKILWQNLFALSEAKLIREFSAIGRSQLGVLCFSETVESILMWSHYSDNHTGFCVEYDFRELEENNLLKRSCFPVFYRRKPLDVSRYLNASFRNELNPFFGTYASLTKYSGWSYEKEWRVVLPVGAPSNSMKISMPKPSGIILGTHTSEENRLTMTEFCEVRNIALKQIVQQPNKFGLTFTQIVRTAHG